jgi:hypothetical protein
MVGGASRKWAVCVLGTLLVVVAICYREGNKQENGISLLESLHSWNVLNRGWVAHGSFQPLPALP